MTQLQDKHREILPALLLEQMHRIVHCNSSNLHGKLKNGLGNVTAVNHLSN